MTVHLSILLITIFCTCLAKFAIGLNVLMAIPCLSGHLIPICSLSGALVEQGHKVDVLVTDDCCATKVAKSCLNISNCYHYQSVLPDINVPVDNPLNVLSFMTEFAENMTEGVFEITSAHLKSHPKYDVIVDDYLLPGAQLAGTVHNIPVVVNVVSVVFLPVEGDIIDRKSLPHLARLHKLPGLLSDFLNHLHFFVEDHFFSGVFYDKLSAIQHRYGLKPALNESYSKNGFYPNSYYYYYSHYVITGPADIGLPDLKYLNHKNNLHYVGFTADSSRLKPLPKFLQTFIDNAEKPVVYMSLGTVSSFKVEQMMTLLEEFSTQEQYAIIWALPSNNYNEIKDKVKTGKHFMLVSGIPQLKLLTMDKVKVFLTHAGANGMQESTYTQTPMLLYPNFADQPTNAYNLVRHKVALELDELTFSEISQKLAQLLEPTFYESAKKRMLESKVSMEKLGGSKKIVQIIEDVAEGKITLVEPPPLINIREEFKKQLAFCMLQLLTLLCLVVFLLITCCKKLRRKIKTD